MTASWAKYLLNFKQPAGTSRGVLRQKEAYFIRLETDGESGLGECGLLRGLSYDDRPEYESFLADICTQIDSLETAEGLVSELDDWPSLQAGLEMAILDLKCSDHLIFPSDFTDGYERQAINGLIWMGEKEFMMEQIESRIEQGFLVLKIKIGAIDIAQELELLAKIRKRFGPHELQLRVDANGAFSAKEVPGLLKELDHLRVHSIEQPIPKGKWKQMAKICRETSVPIALDEELIGVIDKESKIEMLETIQPKYIILKPSFLGGFKKSEEWISLAEDRGIGWWVTSALESNYGLSAISQWNYNLYGYHASGLGTGSLYTNNFESPLHQVRGTIAYDPEKTWDMSALEFK